MTAGRLVRATTPHIVPPSDHDDADYTGSTGQQGRPDGISVPATTQSWLEHWSRHGILLIRPLPMDVSTLAIPSPGSHLFSGLVPVGSLGGPACQFLITT